MSESNIERKKYILKSFDSNCVRGFDCLRRNEYDLAEENFNLAIGNDADNIDAYVGLLMSEAKCDNLDDLADYYKNMFCSDDDEVLEAVVENDDHINEIVDKYAVPGYLEADTIRHYYDFDRSYRSFVNIRKKEKKQFTEYVRTNAVFQYLEEHGSEDILAIIKDIYKAYDERLSEAEKDDYNKSNSISTEYQRFLFKTYRRIKKDSDEAISAREADYKEYVNSYGVTDDVSVLNMLIEGFEALGDYKDAKEYIGKCREKIEESEKKAKTEEFNKKISSDLKDGSDLLKIEDYSAADNYFTNVLDLDPENEDAYLGILMVETKTDNINDLFLYYENLYNYNEPEILKACEEDTEHIEQMVLKYHVPKYLSDERIRSIYKFDSAYVSLTKCRLKQREDFYNEMKTNVVFNKLKEHASPLTLERINELYRVYDKRLEDAQKADEDNIYRIQNAYQRFLYKAYRQLKQEYEEAIDQREADYSSYLRVYNTSYDADKLQEIIDKLEGISDYKEAKKYCYLAKEKLLVARKKEEELAINQEVALELRTARSRLSAHDYEAAEENYTKALDMDPNNLEAFMGILMVENRVDDIDDFFEFYKDLYSDKDFELLEACPEASDHIDRMIDKCKVAGYLSEEQIRECYSYDRTYLSAINCRKRQKELIESEFKENPILAKIAEQGDEEIHRQIYDVFKAYDLRIKEADTKDEDRRQRIVQEYHRFLDMTDEKVIAMSEKAQEQKENEIEDLYQSYIALYEKNPGITDLEQLAGKFRDLEGYKDSKTFVIFCENRIQEIRKQEKKDNIELNIDSLFLYLDSADFGEAKKCLDYVMVNDPKNVKICLGQLMLQTRTRNITELQQRYIDLYDIDEEEIMVACEKDITHLGESLVKYQIEGYLEKEFIESLYDYDLTYTSVTESRERNLELIKDEFDHDPNIVRLREDGLDFDNEWIYKVLDVYEKRLNDSIKADKNNFESINRNYQQFLIDTDRKIRELYREALTDRKVDRRIAQEQERERQRRERAELEEIRRLQAEEDRAKRLEDERRALARARAETEGRRNNNQYTIDTRNKQNRYVVDDVVDIMNRPFELNGSGNTTPVRNPDQNRQRRQLDPREEQRRQEILRKQASQEAKAEQRRSGNQKKLTAQAKRDEKIRQENQRKLDAQALKEEKRKAENQRKMEALALKDEQRRAENEKKKEALALKEEQRRQQEERRKEERALKDEERRLKFEAKQRQKADRKERLKQLATDPMIRSRVVASLMGLVLIGLLVGIGFVGYQKLVVPRIQYNNALKLAEEEKYDEAIAMLEEMDGYGDSANRINEIKYQKALYLARNGSYAEAVVLLKDLNVSDSGEQYAALKKELRSNAKVGDTVIYGQYEQNANPLDGREDLEWVVLAVEDDRLLLLSKYGIDARSYNSTMDYIDWENCELRTWLNGRFPDNAFDNENTSDIALSTLVNIRNSGGSVEEYNTEDKVFLLSTDELERYLSAPADRLCEPTKQAIKNEAWTDSNGYTDWWLRTPGEDVGTTEYVWSQNGSVAAGMNTIVQCLRPAIWIKK